MNLLIDENLSPTLVQRLADRGIFAQHVAHLGRVGVTDPEVWRYAFEHDQIVVTMNRMDFLELAGDCELHPGLIVFREGGLKREEQWEWLLPVLDALAATENLVNEVVEVTGKGAFTRRQIPPVPRQTGHPLPG